MNKSKILRAVLAAVLTLVATTASYAYDFKVGSIYYSKIGEKEVMVTDGDNQYSGDVVIPASVTFQETTYSVTTIGYYSFGYCYYLKSVTIPNSVTSIDDRAFYNCSGLTSVTIPNSVNSIGNYAFDSCSDLTSVSIGNSVTSIGSRAFYNCSGLTSFTIPNSVNSIGYDAFWKCSGLTRVDISSIEAWLGIEFANPDSNPLQYAQHLYLNGEEVKDLVIPNSVTSIGNYAFAWCKGLTSVTIPTSVKSIGNGAFRNCRGLTSFTIPNSVTSIGNYAFALCKGLTSFTIPNSVTSIGEYAFGNCSGLTSVTIGNSVTSIGKSAFEYCDGLTRVDISSIEAWLGIKFADESSNPLTNAHHLYLNGEEVKDLVIPNSVTSIGDRTFYSCSGLTSVTIPNSVTSIGEYAFLGCSGLKSVTIGNSVTSIGSHAFDYCSGLTRVDISSIEAWLGIKFADYYSNPLHYARHLYLNGVEVKDLVIPNSVTSIGERAFAYFSGLTSVTIPNSVNSIGYDAFYECSGLETIFYNAENCADVTANSYVFGLWTSNLNIIIGKDVKKVPNYLFYSLRNAPTSVISKSATPPSCGGNSFKSSAYTTSKLYVPSGAIADYKAANVWKNFTTIEGIETNDAENVADLIEGTNKVNFGLQGVKMHDGVLYACTTAESVNKSTPTLHGNAPDNMDTYEDRNFDEFDQRDWVAISGLEGDFEGKELSNPFVAQFADGVLTPSGTITTTAATKAYNLNTFRAENILHGGYSNYAEGDYKAYYVPARVNEVAKFMGFIETVGGVKYLYSNNDYGRKDGEGIKIEGNIADNLESYSLMEGILVADASTKAGVKIIMLQDFGEATGVEGVDAAAARIYTAAGNIIIAATEDGEAAVYDFTGRLIKSVPVASGDSTAVPVTPGYYIVKTETKTQSVVVK